MNYIWSAMIIASLICGAVGGRLDETVSAAFEGAAASVPTLLSFAGIMCFWTGLLKIAEKSGAADKLRSLLAPAVNFLFPEAGDGAKKYITMNMTANLLGMGNAATPMGISAMRELDAENPHPSRPSAPMITLVALNTASLQIIPSTVLSLRAAASSSDASSVIVPIWIASAAGAAAAIISTRLIRRFNKP